MSQPQYQGQPPAYPAGGEPGYPAGGQPGYAPQSTASNNVVVVSQPGVTIAPGRCRACGGGVIQDNFTVCGIILAILFFPIGILCCFLMMEKRCSSCGVHYG